VGDVCLRLGKRTTDDRCQQQKQQITAKSNKNKMA
jgi:hypothetical protein